MSNILSFVNIMWSSGLVKMSANWSFVLIGWMSIVFLYTWLRKWWYLMAIRISHLLFFLVFMFGLIDRIRYFCVEKIEWSISITFRCKSNSRFQRQFSLQIEWSIPAANTVWIDWSRFKGVVISYRAERMIDLNNLSLQIEWSIPTVRYKSNERFQRRESRHQWSITFDAKERSDKLRLYALLVNRKNWATILVLGKKWALV